MGRAVQSAAREHHGRVGRMRGVAWAAVTAMAAVAAGCQQVGDLPWLEGLGGGGGPSAVPVAAAPATVPAARPPQRAEGLVEARRCGTALGIATRCNLVRDDRDFAVLRFATLDGLGTRYGAVIGRNELEEQIDLATLDRITSISACSLPPGDVARGETAIRKVIDGCARR
jgi:hypothetical protein